ncbi:AcrR family transcriptional regulator [Actinoplanes octamycinicus]|uniref:AcrR family transcriptional regulator n=1 Tax=Actinoplanes octamycinicus TaxID=135948 RepID=A0A7W7GWW5_9ACTN|nr:TetR/AcrR family transcriptional regulator [Actinoplanes octamycinicus]MBB4739778.1 AcrR family transcriptional regulator [Actinoplanes octamycinicus]GIE54961.1 TetR family transcriptional regulator [Actinoplanes octamycinicus]
MATGQAQDELGEQPAPVRPGMPVIDWAWPNAARDARRPSLRKQQAAQTEAELKAAAIRVFERVGYLNAKITDITAEAGRATGSFYKHFAGKEALLEALLADLLTEGDASAELPEHGDDFRDREAVRFHVAAFWGFYRRHRVIMVALQQAALVDEGFAERSRDMLAPDLGHIADHLTGLDLPGDPLVSASLFGATISTFAATWLNDATRPALGRELTDDEAIETLTTFLHRGFGAA